MAARFDGSVRLSLLSARVGVRLDDQVPSSMLHRRRSGWDDLCVTPAIPDDIWTEFDRAIAHAELSPDIVRLWSCRGWADDPDPHGAGGCYWRPWLEIEDEHGFFTPQQLVEAESMPFEPLHRIAVFEDFAPDRLPPDSRIAAIGAALRHELEHVRQQIGCPDALGVDQLLDQAIRVRCDGVPGGAALFNFKPIELDANAAAAAYLREHHPDHVLAILESDCSQLASSRTPPERVETLLARTVACLFLFRDVCESWCNGVPFWQHVQLRDNSGTAGSIWRELEAAALSYTNSVN
jgi:hypothetical protein